MTKNSKKSQDSLNLGNIDITKIQNVFLEDWQKFYTSHFELLWLLFAFVLVVGTMLSMRPADPKYKASQAELKTTLNDLEPELEVDYPQGYKLLNIDGLRLKSLQDDSLKQFKIDWKNSRVLKNDGYEIILILKNVVNRSKQINLKNIRAVIHAEPEKKQSLINANGVQLFFRVLKVEDDKILGVVSYSSIDDEGVF